MTDKVYSGIRIDNGSKRGNTQVTIDDETLYSILVDDDNGYYDSVFDWGYRGFLAKNLSVSILADFFQTSDFPMELVTIFKNDVIDKLPYMEWKFNSQVIETWIGYLKNESADDARYQEQMEKLMTTSLEAVHGE